MVTGIRVDHHQHAIYRDRGLWHERDSKVKKHTNLISENCLLSYVDLQHVQHFRLWDCFGDKHTDLCTVCK